MKQSNLYLLSALLFASIGYLQAQTPPATSSRPGVAVGVVQPHASFVVEQGALKQLTNNLNTALRTKNTADLAKCFLNSADAAWWIAQFDSKGTGIAPEQAAQRILDGVQLAQHRLQALLNSYTGFAVLANEPKWGDPEQRSKAILLTGNLLGSNGSQETVRFFLAVVDGKYKILSIK
jgi:hypothetical protein